MGNNFKTFALLAALMARVIGGAMNFIMYSFSDKLVLKMYGAKIVDQLRQRAGLPMPVSRCREFEADRVVGAEILGRPEPLAARRGGVASLFRTHPPTEKRVTALLALRPSR